MQMTLKLTKSSFSLGQIPHYEISAHQHLGKTFFTLMLAE